MPGGYELVDASGQAVAALTIDGAPEPIPTAAEFFAQPPQITPEVTKAFRTPSRSPPDSQPATADALLGTWVPGRLRGENRIPTSPSPRTGGGRAPTAATAVAAASRWATRDRC